MFNFVCTNLISWTLVVGSLVWLMVVGSRGLWFSSVGWSLFVLFIFVWSHFVSHPSHVCIWSPYSFTSILHLFWFGLSISWCALVAMEAWLPWHLALGWVGLGWISEVVPGLGFCSVMSHLLLLSVHSQQPMRMHLVVSLWGVTGYKFRSVLMPHWYMTGWGSGHQVD